MFRSFTQMRFSSTLTLGYCYLSCCVKRWCVVQVADLIVQSARHESRGLHFSRDYPHMLPQALPTILVPGPRA